MEHSLVRLGARFGGPGGNGDMECNSKRVSSHLLEYQRINLRRPPVIKLFMGNTRRKRAKEPIFKAENLEFKALRTSSYPSRIIGFMQIFVAD